MCGRGKPRPYRSLLAEDFLDRFKVTTRALLRKELVFGGRFHEGLATVRIVGLQFWLSGAERSTRKEAAEHAGKGWHAGRIVGIRLTPASH